VEFLVALGVVNEEGSGGEAGAEAVREGLEGVHNLLGADPVNVPEWPAVERGETEAKDGTDVTIHGVLQSLILKTVHSLVDHPQGHAILDVLDGESALGGN